MDRRNRFYVEKTPKLVRCYDNGGQSYDRYTVVFTGRYRTRTAGEFVYLGMSAEPFHPQGFGQHGSSTSLIDRPRYGHLGRKIPFEDLPTDCRRLVVSDYDDIWRLTSCGPGIDRDSNPQVCIDWGFPSRLKNPILPFPRDRPVSRY